MRLEWSSVKRDFPVWLALVLVIGLLGWLTFWIRDEVAGEQAAPVVSDALVINEISPATNGALLHPSGTPAEFIELFNGTTTPIDLYNYGLSDRGSEEVRWVFPHATIAPGEYLMLYLTGTRAEGLNVSFRLSSGGGEEVTLTTPNGRVLDTVTTVPVEPAEVMARGANGAWGVSKLITPGYPNTEAGFQDYLTSITALSDALVINEVLPRNAANWVFQGGLPEYVELVNTGSESLELGNCYLSDTSARPFRWQLPETTLPPNERFVAYTHDAPTDAPAAGFRLASETGVVVLSCGGKVSDLVDYHDVPNGTAWFRGDMESYLSPVISPGYPDDEAGVAAFLSAMRPNPAGLMLSEMANRNHTQLGQNGGEFYDWIELRNNGDTPVNLADYALSTNGNRKHALPDVILKPGEFYVVMASGDAALSNANYQHLPFKLGENESLYLFRGNELLDGVFLSEIPLNWTMGRSDADGYYYFATPTPLSPNGTGLINPPLAPRVNGTQPGVYNDVESVTVEFAGVGDIYYTTDGSTPTTSSAHYT
ncbi:MAG: lamin tail domain-containing protein, partial [Propionibacteriaceae bacterium]|nr:lamin tail domain-containing protein [Propionibacteriaceae bacterium]